MATRLQQLTEIAETLSEEQLREVCEFAKVLKSKGTDEPTLKPTDGEPNHLHEMIKNINQIKRDLMGLPDPNIFDSLIFNPILTVGKDIGRKEALEETRAFIAHEVKSAIGPLRIVAQLLDETLKQSDWNREELTKYVGRILKQTEAAYQLVDRYVNYARPLTPTFTLTHIDQLLMKILDEFRPKCAQSKIEIVYQLEQSAEILIDRELIAQAFRNVLLNAIEAMEGGGKLTVATVQKADRVTVKISDTGKGIRPEHDHRIFELGFTTKLGSRGAGLGLALVRRIVEEAHNGQVSLRNNPNGSGVTVNIILPMPSEGRFDDE